MSNTLPPTVAALERQLGLVEGTLQNANRLRAEQALKDATTLALSEVSEEIARQWRYYAPDVVDLVIRVAARRGYENPQGFTTESYGDHSASGMSSSGVFLTPKEIEQIHRAATGKVGLRSWTVSFAGDN